MKKELLVACALLALHGCSSHETNTVEAQKYDPSRDARIRVFNNNALASYMYPGQACGQTAEATRVNTSGPYWRAFGAMLNAHKSLGIGMPESQRTRDPKYGEGYQEFVVPASRPLVFVTYVSAPGVSCAKRSVEFIPVAGHSYEAGVGIESGMCFPEVKVLQADGVGAPIADLRACNLQL
ncbi:hypothetical protein [Pseudomonas nitroreducens]|uniref:Uncharacterized protein n=1 Tax=Pseudomonas nitroreducens TaxID=46680 RepID=A0A246F6F9_PSENT|nr:hypothetical protein [Pseudomonas nitroreducens]OWP48797.1 hypothetical protein CEG18_22525 [Pseudomonas nitroreducens]